MKKILFLIAFAFSCTYAHSQIYVVTIEHPDNGNCYFANFDYANNEVAVRVVDPTGSETITCINKHARFGAVSQLNSILNGITNNGYKLINVDGPSSNSGNGSIFRQQSATLSNNTTLLTSLEESSSYIFSAP